MKKKIVFKTSLRDASCASGCYYNYVDIQSYCNILNVYYVQNTRLNILHLLTHLIFIRTHARLINYMVLFYR